MEHIFIHLLIRVESLERSTHAIEVVTTLGKNVVEFLFGSSQVAFGHAIATKIAKIAPDESAAKIAVESGPQLLVVAIVIEVD